jgi:putative transposase
MKPRLILREVLTDVRAAAVMYAKGAIIKDIAARLNVPPGKICHWKRRYSAQWAEAELSVPADQRTRGMEVEREKMARDVSQQVRRAAELAAAGRTDESIAAHMMVEPATVAGWRRIYAEIWNAVYEQEVARIAEHAKRDMETLKGGNRPLWALAQSMFLRKTKIHSGKTRKHYRYSLNNFEAFLGRPSVMSDLKNDTVTLWLNDSIARTEAEGGSVCTTISYVTRVLTLWRFLNDMGEMPTRPVVEMPSPPEPVPTAITEDELRRLFEAAQCQPGTVFGVPARYWWPALFGFVFCTSERKGATFAMRWAWVDLKAKVVQIPAGVRKGKKKGATYKLWEEVVTLLERIRAPKRDLVFAWPKSEATFYKQFGNILADAGLPVDRKHKLLTGQHSPLLQHSSSRTSERHYEDRRFTIGEAVKPFVPWATPPKPVNEPTSVSVVAVKVNGKAAAKLPRAKVITA